MPAARKQPDKPLSRIPPAHDLRQLVQKRQHELDGLKGLLYAAEQIEAARAEGKAMPWQSPPVEVEASA